MLPDILYEDNHLIAVNKPAGLLVQGDKTGDPNLLVVLKKHLKDKYNKSGNVFLGLVHRIDRPVSGIVLFAKTSKAASRISDQIREHELGKIYHALVIGRLRHPAGTLRNYLWKDTKRKKAIITELQERGSEAILRYKVMKSNNNYSLLRIELETGRFHQIRAQLAEIGHPILGDLKYGAKEPLPDKAITLCATELTFRTVTTDEIKTISIHYPQDWDKYLL